MHHIYTTPAFIIHGTPQGEAGKFLLLFTRDFGMIGATAQGVRLSKSKLRCHIQDYNFLNISVVKGKEMWRVTGANEIGHQKITLIHLKIFKLLRRLLHGEEKNEKLFEIIESLYKADIVEKDIEFVEYLTVFRILNTLGYIKETNELSRFLINNSIDQDIIENMKKSRQILIQNINNALNMSHL